jgi:solute carrier family 32 (vesicular inhibitory amino acid transporter)
MPRNPTTFEEYQYGPSGSHRSSVSSAGGRSIRFDEQVGSPSANSAFQDASGGRSEGDQHGGDLRRRR